MAIELIPVIHVKRYKNNPRIHNNIKDLVQTIKRHGFNIPVVIDENNVLITGHARLTAAEELDLEVIPALRAVGLSEELKREYRIADNKVAEIADWDQDRLSMEIREVRDIAGLIGFKEYEIDLFLKPADIRAVYEEEDFQKITQKQESVYSSKVQQVEDDLYSMICQACGAGFAVSKKSAKGFY